MTMTEQEKFNKLVECAEKFVVYNAEIILKTLRLAIRGLFMKMELQSTK